MSPRVSSLASALVLISLVACSPKSPQPPKAPSAVAQAEQIAQEPGSGRPVAPPAQPESLAPEAAKSPAKQGGEARPLPHLDPDHAVYWLLRHGTDSADAAKAYCDVHRTGQRGLDYCGYKTHAECVALKTTEFGALLHRDRSNPVAGLMWSSYFTMQGGDFELIESVAISCGRERRLLSDLDLAMASPTFDPGAYAHLEVIRSELSAELERCRAHNKKILGALHKRTKDETVLRFRDKGDEEGQVAYIYTVKTGQRLRDVLSISKQDEKEWRQALTDGNDNYGEFGAQPSEMLRHLDSPMLYGFAVIRESDDNDSPFGLRGHITQVDCHEEGCCDALFEYGGYYGEKGELFYSHTPYVACPFVYTPDSEEASGWRYRGEILRNLRHPSLETTQDLDLADASLCDALVFRVRMTEEKEETSFVDAVWLRVGEALIAPSRCSRASQGEVCEDDGRYVRLEHGEVIEFAFELTEGQRAACREGAVALVANGYYLPR